MKTKSCLGTRKPGVLANLTFNTLIQGFWNKALGATERFSGGHEKRPSLGTFAVILHNPSVWEAFKGLNGSWRFENHCSEQ